MGKRPPSIVTSEANFCLVCGRGAADFHHLIFGKGRRTIGSTDDRVTIPLCDECHTIGRYRLHDNPTAETLSKIAGQLAWERAHILEGFSEEDRKKIEERTRDAFIKRYGMSWI